MASESQDGFHARGSKAGTCVFRRSERIPSVKIKLQVGHAEDTGSPLSSGRGRMREVCEFWFAILLSND